MKTPDSRTTPTQAPLGSKDKASAGQDLKAPATQFMTNERQQQLPAAAKAKTQDATRLPKTLNFTHRGSLATDGIDMKKGPKQLFGWSPFKHSQKEQGTPRMIFLKWFIPGFVNACCIFTSMWLLHIATYEYVHRMTDMEKQLLVDSHAVHHNKFSNQFVQDFGGLQDPAADLFPKSDLTLSTLDSVAAFFPMVFMAGVVFYDDLRLYTKVMVCNAILALIKGTVDSMTILPDSAGWETCKERLTPLGVSFFQQDHSWFGLLFHEAVGVNGTHLRWCSDMLVSGHTYFTTLYALATYELVRIITRKRPDKSGAPSKDRLRTIRWIALIIIALIAIGEQIVEITFVTVDRFHYTMDIYIALILTFIIYTNAVPTILSKRWWELKSVISEKIDGDQDALGALESQADILVPVCCIPFCCWAGRRLHVYDDEHVHRIIDNMAMGMALTPGHRDISMAQAEKNASIEMEVGEGISVKDLCCGFCKNCRGGSDARMKQLQKKVIDKEQPEAFGHVPSNKFQASFSSVGKEDECSWFPLLRTSRRQQGRWSLIALKWFLPGFINGCCILISMWLLHIATYQYVHRMTKMETILKTEITEQRVVNDIIDRYGGLKDPAADMFPRKNLPLSTLDTVAAIFPMSFMLGVIVFDNVNLYTKVMLCNAILALIKGTVDSMTILPDSAGWETCKERLTPLGVSFMQGEHTFLELLYHEVFGVNGQHLRWCSDMLVSGHTYFTALYALGAYELMRIVTMRVGKSDHCKNWGRIVGIIGICLLAIGEQCLEVYYVIVDRFHYSMDLYLAIILTLAIYTNAVPTLIGKYWWLWSSKVEEDHEKHKDEFTAMQSQADILLPVCCVPFCCFAGRFHVYDDAHIENVINGVLKAEGSEGHASELKRKATKLMNIGEGVTLGQPLLP